MIQLTEKEKLLLRIAQECASVPDYCEFRRNHIILDQGLETEIEKHYPVKFPGQTEEDFADKEGLSPDDCSDEEFEASLKRYERAYDDWTNQYDVIWQDIDNLLGKLQK